MLVAFNVPVTVDAAPSVKLLLPRVRRPDVKFKAPLKLTFVLKLTPAALLMVRLPAVAAPTPVPATCAAAPLKLKLMPAK